MASKVCLLTLASYGSHGVRKAREQIGDVVSDYFSDAQLSADFNSQKELIECLHSQLKSVHTAIIAAEPEQFSSLKLTLMKMFSLRVVKSRTIIDAVGDMSFSSQREYDLQVALPEKARIFISSDGLYSGFAFKKGSHCIVLLPLDCARLDYMLVSELSPFLGELSAVSKRMEARSGLEDSVKRTVDSLAQNGYYIALSNVGCAPLMQKCLRLSNGFDKVFVVDVSPAPPEGEENINSYIAVAAKTAKENTGADVGIAISDICNDAEADTDYTVVSIANSMRARVVKVFSEPGDDPKALVLAAIGKLLRMLDEFSDEEEILSHETASIAASAPTVKRLPVRGVAALVVCLFVAIAACVGIACYLSGAKDASPAHNSTYNADLPAIAKVAAAGEPDLDSLAFGGEIIENIAVNTLALPAGSALSTLETTGVNGQAPPTEKLVAAPMDLTQPQTTAVSVPEETTAPPETTVTTETVTVATTAKQVITTVAATVASTIKSEEPSTTKPAETSSKAAEETTTASADTLPSGTFTFTVYGFGHGVGMSQDGAIAMANSGKHYEQIVENYFPGTVLVTDTNVPATIKYGSANIPLVEYLCRTTVREIGPSAPFEALKAQICIVYTYAKYYGFNVASDRHAYDYSYQYINSNVYFAAISYLGSSDISAAAPKYVSYNGAPAFTCYFSNAAGKTVSAKSVWGGDKYPYLPGGCPSPEKIDVTTVTFSAAEMRRYILAYDSNIVLSSNPAQWLEIVSHDACVSSSVGYVNTIRVGNTTMTGNRFRGTLMDYDLRSHCFSVVYTPEEGK